MNQFLQQQLVSSSECHVAIFTAVFNSSWEVITFNVILSVNLLSINLSTHSTFILSLVNAICNLSINWWSISLSYPEIGK